MVWRQIFLVLVLLNLFIGSRICCSLATDASYDKDYQEAEGKVDQTDSSASFKNKHLVTRSLGDGLNVLKEQAGRASSVYKWLKENWKKLLVIIVALFALIFVIGIYRRCFSDSSSAGDDDEPNVLVVTRIKQNNKFKGQVECLDPVLAEENTQQNDGSGKAGKGSPGQITYDFGNKGDKNTRITNGSKENRKTLDTTKKRVVTTIPITGRRECHTMPLVNSERPIHFQQARIVHTHENSIPISGYSTFQQSEFSMFYFNFIQYLSERTGTDRLSLHAIRASKGCINEGPFPFYEEIPLIEMMTTALAEQYRDNYLPTARANNLIPLTISL